MTTATRTINLNGRVKGKRNLVDAAVKAKKPRSSNKGKRNARRLAAAVGAVGVGVLSLSVAHCTESIGLLTGSHWFLSGLLALGIDAGMVACELAELVAGHNVALRRWAMGYTVTAVLLSVLLNAYAFGLHAAAGMVWAAWLLGAAVPGLVYALGRVAGYLYQQGE